MVARLAANRAKVRPDVTLTGVFEFHLRATGLDAGRRYGGTCKVESDGADYYLGFAVPTPRVTGTVSVPVDVADLAAQGAVREVEAWLYDPDDPTTPSTSRDGEPLLVRVAMPGSSYPAMRDTSE
jgi:hypothetical protein